MDDVEVSTLANRFTSVPVESPFVWGMSALLVKESSNILERLLEKQDVVEEHYEQFKWSHFVIQLLLSYELCNSGNQSEAVKKIESCEAELTRLDRIGCNERFYLRMRRPLWHLTLASRALLFATISNFEVDLDYLDQEMGQKYNLTLFSDEERASLYGTKTICYLEYGYNGNMEALKWARKALETDPSEAEWHFLTGKCMGRVRRCTRKFSGVPREEVEMIEKAVSLNPNPKYIMYVAQVYQQSASAAFIHHRGDENFYKSSLYQAINNMNKKAVELYQQALVFRPNCSYTYIRCLNGMLKLPRKYLNLAQLRKMVDKVTMVAPNNTMFLHSAGVFYLKMDYDAKKALKFFEMASDQGNYGASMDAIRLRFRMNEQYNPVGRLRKLIEKFSARPHHEDAVSQLGSFYLFIVRDLERALEAYNLILEKDPESRAMMVHKPIFVRMTRPINLFEVLVNEVRVYELKERPLDEKLKDGFMSLVAQYFPSLLELEVDTQMIHRLIQESRRMARAEKRRRVMFLRYSTTERSPRKDKSFYART
uniref:Uncharacterized protein n=1 Tax=Homalodisca liturata TaxID=320908 RepID=A0A1B6IGP4_9HEMI